MRVLIKDNDIVIDELPVTDIGILGELKVWQKLKELGYGGELFTFTDHKRRYDIRLDNGTAIEVKGARCSANWSFKPGKDFDFRVGGVYAFNMKSSPSDFVIIYIEVSEHGVFYVVPTEMLNKGVNKIFPDATRWKFFKDNWDLLRIKGTG